MARILDPNRIQSGDVILVMNEGPHALRSRIGQTVLRFWQVVTFNGGAAFSHVMLGYGPGLVIHANGTTVLAESLAAALDEGISEITDSNFRVRRNVDPPLDPKTANAIAKRAEFFGGQQYTFRYGRRSRFFGRWRHKERLTLPFCSELVADAYKFVGRPIGHLPPDRVLPIDLQALCVQPGWADVSAEFFVDPPRTVDIGKITVGEREMTLDEWFAGSDQALETRRELDAQQINLKKIVVDTGEALVAIEQARVRTFELTQLGVAHPMILFDGGTGSLAAAEASQIDDFYRVMRIGLNAAETPFANAIVLARPDVDPDQPPYEGSASANETRRRELEGLELAFFSRATRLVHILIAVLVGLGVASGEERHKGFNATVVWPVVDALPDLTEERESDLRATAANLTGYTAKLEPSLRRICETIVDRHRLITVVKRRTPLAPDDNRSPS